MTICRRITHILVKILERLPSFADFDATSAVVLVVWYVGIVAAAVQLTPNFVCAGPFAATCLPVRGLALHAPATTTGPTLFSQPCADDKPFGAAVASAQPEGVSFVVDGVKPDNCPLAESHPGNVDDVIGKGFRFRAIHCFVPL